MPPAWSAVREPLRAAALLLDDLYRPGAPKLAPPTPTTAHRVDDEPNQLVVDPTTRLAVEDGAAADYRVRSWNPCAGNAVAAW